MSGYLLTAGTQMHQLDSRASTIIPPMPHTPMPVEPQPSSSRETSRFIFCAMHEHTLTLASCKTGAYCDAASLQCFQEKRFGQACTGNKEYVYICPEAQKLTNRCQSYNCEANAKCGRSFDEPIQAPAYAYALIAVGIVLRESAATGERRQLIGSHSWNFYRSVVPPQADEEGESNQAGAVLQRTGPLSSYTSRPIADQ